MVQYPKYSITHPTHLEHAKFVTESNTFFKEVHYFCFDQSVKVMLF